MVNGQNNFILGGMAGMSTNLPDDTVFDDDEDFYEDDDLDYEDDDLDFYEDEYGLEDDYEGFEKIRHPHKSEEEVKGAKKKSSVKHQKRVDKE